MISKIEHDHVGNAYLVEKEDKELFHTLREGLEQGNSEDEAAFIETFASCIYLVKEEEYD